MSAASRKGDPIAELQAENEALRAQLDAARNESLDAWLRVMHHSGVAARDYERTLSWRVTRPLRVARRIQIAVREVGVSGVAVTALGRLRTRLRSR